MLISLEKCTYSDEACTTGDQAGAQATGYQAGATAIGTESTAFADGPHAVACAMGKDCRAKGTEGTVLFLVERGNWAGEGYPIKEAKVCRVGENGILPNVWYELKDGEITPYSEE